MTSKLGDAWVIVLNLGCGTITSEKCINVDWSIYLRISRSIVLRCLATPFLTRERRQRLDDLAKNIVIHDLKNSLPFENDSVDMVYHSHVFEHLDRDCAPSFLSEIKRVLKPGAVHRVCVPDLEVLARSYLEHLDACRRNTAGVVDHDRYVHDMLEQCVRRRASGSDRQPPWRRFIEHATLGDARRRGETHQWMYDEFNLRYLLESGGFIDVRRRSAYDSSTAGWTDFCLDTDEAGNERKPGSLYLECRK